MFTFFDKFRGISPSNKYNIPSPLTEDQVKNAIWPIVNSFEELPSKAENSQTNLDLFYELVDANKDIVDPAWKISQSSTLFEEAARRGNVKMVEYLVTTPKYRMSSDVNYRATKRLESHIKLVSDIKNSYKNLIIQDYVLSEKRGEVGIEGWEDDNPHLVVMKDGFYFKDDEYMRKIALRFLDNYFKIIRILYPTILCPTIVSDIQPVVDKARTSIVNAKFDGGSKRKTKRRRKRSKKSRARRK